jgi:hypothetical protein
MVVSDSSISKRTLLHSSSNRKVHRLYPEGGSLQLNAIIFASTSPVTLAGTDGVSRFSRFTSRSSPSFTYCLLTVYTKTLLHWHRSAISRCSGTGMGFPSRSSPHSIRARSGYELSAVPDVRPYLRYPSVVFLHLSLNGHGMFSFSLVLSFLQVGIFYIVPFSLINLLGVMKIIAN